MDAIIESVRDLLHAYWIPCCVGVVSGFLTCASLINCGLLGVDHDDSNGLLPIQLKNWCLAIIVALFFLCTLSSILCIAYLMFTFSIHVINQWCPAVTFFQQLLFVFIVAVLTYVVYFFIQAKQTLGYNPYR